MPALPLGPDETLHVLVPSRAIGAAVEKLSPRVRVHRVDAEAGPPEGEATQAQVWVPGNGAAVPGNGFLDALPRLRLVQLLSAGAEKFIGRLPEGVVLANARGAHTPATAEWAVAATLAAQRGLPFFVREQEAGRWSFGTHRSLVGARVLTCCWSKRHVRHSGSVERIGKPRSAVVWGIDCAIPCTAPTLG